MTLSTQPYKGTRDFYPADMVFRRWMFGVLRDVVSSFGYQEYDGPVIEPFELYAAKSGEELVNQQLYSFQDRGERKMAIRPEMTPTLARLVAAKVNELPKPIRLFSIPNLMRYERPQKGRLREHWQLNVDVLGGAGELADAEILEIAATLLEKFGGLDKARIKINSRRLMDHLFAEALKLTPEQTQKASKLIDAKDKIGPEVFRQGLRNAGLVHDQIEALEAFFSLSLDQAVAKYPCAGTEELKKVFSLLPQDQLKAGVYVFDPSIMRGMDYYTGIVFEAFDISPENPRALFGGGRYDNLIGMFGNHKLSGMGFGMGDVTLENFLRTHNLVPKLDLGADVLVTTPSVASGQEALYGLARGLARDLRAHGVSAILPLSLDGFGNQLKLANKLGSKFVVLLGEAELAKGEVALKDLRSGEQTTVSQKDLVKTIQSKLA